jgi:acyl-CoA thioesterase-1
MPAMKKWIHLAGVAGVLAGGCSEQPDPGAGSDGWSGVVLFLGDSLTDGHALGRRQAYPTLIQEKIHARGWSFEVVNAGVSGDRSADGLRRLDGLLKRPVAVLVLALGINDAFGGVPTEDMEQNLQRIIDRAREAHPGLKLVIAGTRLEGVWRLGYGSEFEEVFPRLARANDAVLIPSLLAGVAGKADLNMPDGLHPNAAGHALMAENMWKALEPVLAGLR